MVMDVRIVFRMRNVLNKSCRENKNSQYSIFVFRKICHLWDDKCIVACPLQQCLLECAATIIRTLLIFLIIVARHCIVVLYVRIIATGGPYCNLVFLDAVSVD